MAFTLVAFGLVLHHLLKNLDRSQGLDRKRIVEFLL
jgi:hypothetical protein